MPGRDYKVSTTMAGQRWRIRAAPGMTLVDCEVSGGVGLVVELCDGGEAYLITRGELEAHGIPLTPDEACRRIDEVVGIAKTHGQPLPGLGGLPAY